jgi:copper transport protein
MGSGGLSRPPSTRSRGRSNLPVRRSPSIRPSADGAGALTARRRIAAALLRTSIAAAILAMVAILVGPASPASAHATLLFTSPAVDGAVPTSPEEIQLVFDQGVIASGSSLRLSDDTGRAWRLGAIESGSNDQTVSARVPETLPAGTYVVGWQATASDAEVMVGRFRFAVGSISGLSFGGGAGDVEAPGLTATAALRWLLFAGLALALGGLFGGALTSRVKRGANLRTPQPWLRAGALVGASASAGLALILVGRESLLEGLRTVSLEALLSSTPGRLGDCCTSR